MSAAATARPMSGGRNVASVRDHVDEMGFAAQIGVNDNGMLRYEDDLGFQSGSDKQERQDAYTPLMFRTQMGFQVEQAEEGLPPASGGAFLAELTAGIGAYESVLKVTTPGMVKAGSVLNHLY